MKIIFKYFAFILSALLLVVQVKGQDFQFLPDGDLKTYYSKNIKTNGGSNTVYNEVLGTASAGEWFYMKNNSSTWMNKYQFKSVVNTIGVKIDHASKVVQANYKYKIVLQVTGYDNPSSPTTGTTLPNYEFELEYNKDSLAAYKDLNILRLPGAGFYSFEVKLIDVFDISSGTPVSVGRASLAENFIIEAKVSAQRYDFDDLTMKDVFINSQYNSATQSLDVHWANMPMNEHKFTSPGYLPLSDLFKPVKYELEWLYIDDYVLNANGTKSYRFSSSSYTILYDFRNNSTRIQTNKNSYSIPMVYGHGAVIFRLRKVRPSSVNFSETVYYPWNLAETGTLTPNQFYVNGNSLAVGCPMVAPSNCLFINESPFVSDSLNWQYNVSFAEEGKYKHVVNYFDGMGKNRQTQTKINSDNEYVIGIDNIFDYEGRRAISTLPTPIQSQDIKYKPNLTLNAATGQPYKAADFDSGCGTDSIAPLSSQALSNIYYSGLNPDKAGMQKFVPDAQGYPIVETRYAADYTDKVQWLGGAGLEFQRWKGKGTKYVYSRAGQRELNRLLGSEGGFAQYYPKQTIINQNGQASFSITNASGKIVASGLSGTSPDSTLYPIESLNTLPAATYHEYDVLKGLTQDTGRTFRNAQSSYFNEALSENSLKYSLKIPPFLDCWGSYIHVAADYKIKLIEECKTDTTAPAIIEITGQAGVNEINSNEDPMFGTSTTGTAQVIPDKYTIIKELKFSDSAINRLSADYAKWHSGVGMCYKGPEPFVRTEIESSTFPCPPDSSSSGCEALKRQMMKELYPGAKYGQYMKGPDGKFATGMPNSIFTKIEPPISSYQWVPRDTMIREPGDRCMYVVEVSQGTRIYPTNQENETLQEYHTYPCTLHVYDDIRYETLPFELDPGLNFGDECGLRYTLKHGPWQCHYLAPSSGTLECEYEVSYSAVLNKPHNCSLGNTLFATIQKRTFWLKQPATFDSIPQTITINMPWQCACGNSGFEYDVTASRFGNQLPAAQNCRYLKPHFRFQSACLGTNTTIPIQMTSLTGTKFTVTRALIDVTPDMLIASFNDEIAEALLPLHPEYCKLQVCDQSDFDGKLQNLETYEQAQSLGLHTLAGILSKDPISQSYAAGPAGPVAANKLSFFEMDANLTASQADILRRFDTMALIRAYCGSNSSQASIHCEKTVHAADIATMNLSSTEIKDRFFRAMRDLYLANRSLRLQQFRDGLANSCGPCANMPDERMNLIGEPVFPVVFGSGGSFDLDLHNTDLENLINSRINNTTDNTVPAYVTNMVNGAGNTNVTDYCKGQIDMIIKDLEHCGMGTTALNNIRNGLNGYCSTNADLPKITPEVVRNLIQVYHGTLSDLCQPFITQYRLFEPSAENLGDYVSKPQALYEGLNVFMNRPAVVNAVKTATATAGTFAGISLDPANAFDVALANRLNVVTNATVNVSAMTNNVTVAGNTLPVIRLSVGLSGNYEYLYLSSRAVDANLLPNSGASSVSFTDAKSVMADYPSTPVVEGGIADKVAFIKLSVGGQTSRYSVWSTTIPFLKLKNKDGIEDCINCELLRRGITAYKADATYYSLPLNTGHPLFQSSLKNYLNYNLKANQSAAAYAGLMEGCAISDKIDFKNATATIELTLATGSGQDIFGNAKSRMQSISAQFPDISIPYYAFRRTNGNVMVRINLASVDTAKLRYVIPAIMNTGNAVYLPQGYDAELFGNGFGTVSIPNATTSLEPVDFMSQDHTVSSLNWLQVTGTAGAEPLTKANLMDAVGSYIRSNPNLALYRLNLGYKLYRAEDYTNTNKQDYLNAVYAQGSLDASALADKLTDMPFLNTAVPGLSSFDKSYNNPWHQNAQSDLLFWNQGQTHAGKTRVQNTINQVKAVLGSNKLFPAISQVNISGTTGLNNNSVKAFRMANGYAWYRIFDFNNRAYNIYLVPSKQMIDVPEQYQLSSTNPNIKLLGGDSVIYRFSVTMVKGAHTVEVQGFTDFPIGTGGRLQNVVIQKDAYRKGEAIDTMSCEQGIRSFAEGQGLQAYRSYMDSVERRLQFAIRDHLVKNTVDTLIHGTKEQQYHYTLYYYDQAGNLTKTVPPQGVNPIAEPSFTAVEQARNATTPGSNLAQKANHNKISRYRYNSFNQPVWQQTPDGGITEFFYDRAGRLAFSQNAKQLQDGTFSYTLYDQQGRIEETGVLTATRLNVEDVLTQSIYDGISPYVNWVKGKTRTEVVATRYDEPVISLGGHDMLNEQRNLKKRVSAVLYSPSVTTQQSINEYYHFATHFSYDAMGNVDMLVQDNPYLNYMQQRFKRVDYDYDLLSGKVNMLSFNRGHADQFYQRYSYDADNRITKAETSKDGLKWDRDAAYAYYKHGPLAEMQLGDLNVQGVQYAYTIQGWLKAINGDVLNPGDDMGKNGYAAGSVYPADVMAHSLDYFKNDYKAIEPTALVTHTPALAKSLYNGNIARQTTAIAGMDNLIRDYSYDQLNRIKSATYSAFENVSYAVTSLANAYKNTYSYDADGNLQTLKRLNGQGTEIDNFTYHYTNATQNNKLSYVQDVAAATGDSDLQPGQSAANYTYDVIGNLTTDRQEGIKAIEWNSYGKMSRLVKGTTTEDTLTMVFHYDGLGNRIRKDVWREIPGSSGGIQDRVSDIYAHDAQGNILAVYKEQARVNGGATIDWLNSQLYQVASTSEMAAFYSTQFGNNGNFTSNLYDYSLMEASSWAEAQLSQRSGRFYINQSAFMFGHALETQLVDSWTQLSEIDPAEFLPLLKESEGDLGRTGRLLSAALQSGSTGVNTLEHLSNTDDDFMAALFLNLPDGYRIEDAQKITDMGPEGRTAHLSGLMDQQGAAPIADAFVQASLNVQPNTFLGSWLYDNKIFNSSNLGSDDELKKTLKDCIISSENAAALAVVRDHFGNWMDASLPGYFEESFTPQDRLNVVYNSDKVAFFESFIGSNGMAGITGSLVQIPGLTGLSYSNTIIGGVSLGLLNPAILQYVNTPSPQNIDTDTLWLAEHHLYGSSRLGIKQYEPQQYRNVYSNTQPFVKGINVKQPWHSGIMDEEIKSGIKSLPLLSSHYLTDTFRYMRNLGTKYYELNDHLTNVLATVLDRKTGYGSLNGDYTGFKADIASATDYYPFGMEMPDRSISSECSRFGYNGQERDNEVRGTGNSYAYEYRMYDPRIGRFLSIDPLSQRYPYYTPYQFAGNRVIACLDLEGLEDVYYLDKNIKELNGHPIIQILNEVPLFQEDLKKFQDPDFNKGYNLIIIDGWPKSSSKGKIKDAMMDGQVIDYADAKTTKSRYEQFLEGTGFPDDLWTKQFYESRAVQESIKQGRGVVIMALPEGTNEFTVNSAARGEWYINVGKVVKILIHEFFHVNQISSGKQINQEVDHELYHADPTVAPELQWGQSAASPGDQTIKYKYPNSPAGLRNAQVDEATKAKEKKSSKKPKK